MRKCPCKIILFTEMVFLLVFLGVGALAAEKKSGSDSEPTGERIVITGDRLTVDNRENFARFQGNVKASQGKTVITADSITIYYLKSQSGKTGGDAMTGSGSIKKILAEGKVTIRFDGNVAETEKAEYSTRDRLLVLSGTESRVISEKGKIFGSKIIVNRETGNISVEGNGKKPVEAWFFPGKKGIE